MTRPWIRCAARMANGFQCDARAKYWVERGVWAPGSTDNARCGTHARHYDTVWPLLTADPVADRAIAEGVFS